MCKNRAKLKTQKKSTKRQKSTQTSIKNASPLKTPPKVAPKSPAQALEEARRIWYLKLRQSGFRDLETSGLKPWRIHDGPLMGNSLQTIARMYQPETELFYRRVTHYLTHNPDPMRDATLNKVCKMFGEGISYREITRRIRAKGGRMNIHKVHHIVRRLLEAVKTWNKINPNGVDFEVDLQDPNTLEDIGPTSKQQLRRTKY